MASVDTGAIEGEIARLRVLDLEGLVLGLGYRLQEIAQGSLSKGGAADIAKADEEDGGTLVGHESAIASRLGRG